MLVICPAFGYNKITMDAKKNIVVLGAGFGGLHAARKIARGLEKQRLLEKYEVTLIDQNDHHTFTPLLYEAATTSKETANLCDLHDLVAYPVASLVRDESVSFLKRSVVRIDPQKRILVAEGGEELKFDYLVLATGAEINFFGIAGLETHALPIKTFIDAIRIRETLWELVTRETQSIDIVIGGGGSTGVELAGEIVMWYGEARGIAPECRIRTSIVEATNTILPGFPKSIVTHASRRLQKLGVSLIMGDAIESVNKNAVVLQSGTTIPFTVLIWAGGLKAPSLLESLPIKTAPYGRIEVSDSLQCVTTTDDLKLSSFLYAIGDSICFYNPLTKKPIPGIARAALSQANVVAYNILEEIKESEGAPRKASQKIFRPWNYPYVIPIGGKYAIAKLGPLIISGFPAWILKGLVELNYLLSIMPPQRALGIWFKGLLVFMKNDRLG